MNPIVKASESRSDIQASDQIAALSQLPRDIAIIKMDNENMMAMAAARPRDYVAIQRDLEAQIKAFPDLARTGVYAKPVGRMDKCPSCGTDTYYKETCPQCRKPIPQKIARGLSVRAAEALRLSFGYTRLDQTAEELPGRDVVQLTTSVVDYQTGNITRKSFPVSKSFKNRRGEIQRIPDDRFYDVVIKAKAAIQSRDCIMAILPPGMKAGLQATIIKEQQALLDDDTVKAIISKFANKRVTESMLEGFIGKPINAFTQEDRATLLSLWTGLEDGETTVSKAFGVDSTREIKPPQKKQESPEHNSQQEQEYAPLSSVVGAPVGDEFVVRGTVSKVMSLQVGKSNDRKDKTNITLTDNDANGEVFSLECSAWGKHQINVGDGITGKIVVGEYMGRPQYTISNIKTLGN